MLEKSPITNTEPASEKIMYEYFMPSKILDIVKFTKDTVEFLEKLGESNVIFFDRSARLAFTAIDEYWNLKHGTDGLQKPNFYFVNPDGFKLKYLGDMPTTFDSVEQQVSDVFGKLDKNKPIVFVDVCIHKGRAMNRVTKYFEQAGFTDIKYVIANTKNNSTDIKSEVSSIDSDTCYVFLRSHDTGDLVDSVNNSIFSSRNDFDPDLELAKNTRKELRQIISDFYDVKVDL